MLTREQILKPRSLAVTKTTLYGEPAHVRTLSAAEKDHLEETLLERRQANQPGNYRALLLTKCLCDAEGRRILQDTDAEALSQQPAAGLDEAFTAACRANAVTKADIQELEKKSEAPAGDSS